MILRYAAIWRAQITREHIVFNQRLTQWTEYVDRDEAMEGNSVFQPPQHSAPGVRAHCSPVEATYCSLGK